MRKQTFTTRRGATRRRAARTTGWVRHRNVAQHAPKTLGPIFQTTSLTVLVIIVGLIYVAQGTRATNYDYELSRIDGEIAELTARKEDLAVEKARLTSIAASESSKVAVAMPNAKVSGYAE